MGIFHTQAESKKTNGLYPVQQNDIVRPINKRYENEEDRISDINNKININMYFEMVATYCAGAAKLILDEDYEALRNLDDKFGSYVEKLDLTIAGTVFDSEKEKDMAKKTLNALKMLRNANDPTFKSIFFANKQDGYKFLSKLQTCCEFLGKDIPLECINNCANYGYFTNIVPILYHQIYDKNFKFNSEHPYCQEILRLYSKMQQLEQGMGRR